MNIFVNRRSNKSDVTLDVRSLKSMLDVTTLCLLI